MKLDRNSKYFRMSLYLFLAIAASMVFFLFLQNLAFFINIFFWFLRVLSPFISAFFIAYLLNPIMCFFESLILNKNKDKKHIRRARRIFALLLTYIIVIIGIAVFCYIVLPQLANSLYGIIRSIPSYIISIRLWLNEFLELWLERFSIDLIFVEDILNQLSAYFSQWGLNLSQHLPQLYTITIQFTTGITNFILAFVISIYMLYSKEIFIAQFKKGLFALFPQRVAAKSIYLIRLVHSSFGGFISGKIIDSVIIGILCFIGMRLLNIEYAVLISVIVGITNVIPYFGPFIGAIPSILIVFFVSPFHALVLAIFILALQQFDGNILGPKILGDSIGLPPFWIIFSVIVGGGMFGVPGMFVGVPIFAVIYTLSKGLLQSSLQKKGLSAATGAYKHGHFPGEAPPDDIFAPTPDAPTNEM